jgi:fatty-acyl-CoA synthase
MQDWPLTVDRILDHARAWHSHREVVTRSVEGPIVRTTYGAIHTRAKQLSNALLDYGVRQGDRIATLAWNSGNHMEVWYGIMGIGAICHTLNPRLFSEQLAWIINHAEDRIIFTDLTFLPQLETVIAGCPSVEKIIILTDDAHMVPFTPASVPGVKFSGVQSYESFIAGRPADAAWGGFDENTAAGLCYTSGTTGNPKGVLYSHRSNFLHTLSGLSKDILGLDCNDVILPVVPMFHANAWGIAFDGPAAGAKLVMPGPKADGASIHELMESEGVTVSAAVPTVWQMLLQHLDDTGGKLTTLKRIYNGGAALPESIVRRFKDYGVDARAVWGMTETSPLGTVCNLTPEVLALPYDQQLATRVKGGRPPLGIELKIVDDEGRRLPHDGATFGRLFVKGPFVSRAYFKGDGGDILDSEGFFDTGDVATIDPNGFLQITDRAKDVVKSGGEWISTIEIENIALSHPKTALAAVIGVPHPKWDERPILLVKLKDGETATREEYLAHLDGKIAKWWTPDDVLFVDDIPLGATGKIDKKVIRAGLKDYVLPSLAVAAPAAAAALAAEQPEVVYADEPPTPAAEEPVEAEIAPAAEAEALVEPAAEAEAEPEAETEAALEVEPAAAAESSSEPASSPDEPIEVAATVEDEVAPFVDADAVEASAPPAAPSRVLDESPFAAAPRRVQKPVSPFGRGVLNLFLLVALAPAVLVAAAALAVRLGWIDWRLGYGEVLVGHDGDMSLALKIAFVGAVTGALGFFVALFTSPRKLLARALLNIAITAATLAALGWLYDYAAKSPPVHDVATDWVEPLTFSDATMARRGAGAQPVDLEPVIAIDRGAYAGRPVAEINAEACPAARPVIVDKSPAAAFAAARAALEAAGMQVTVADADNGRIEALATSPIYGFRDDVVVRVRQHAQGSRIDARAVARERDADFGANCERISGLMAALRG